MQNPHIFKGFDSEMESLNQKLSEMAKECELQLTKAVDALTSLDNDLAKYIIKRDELINQMHQEIEHIVVVLISRREPKASDLRYVLSGFKISSELERIGDYAANIAKQVTKIKTMKLEGPTNCIILMARIATKMLNGAISALFLQNIEKAKEVWHMDDEIDHNYSRMLTEIRKIMRDSPESVDDCTTLMFMARCCERIGDHITNISEDVYYIKTGVTCSDCFE